MDEKDLKIQELRRQLATVTSERDAAVKDIYHMGGCPNCKSNIGRSDRTGLPICKKNIEYPNGRCFEWRGVQEKNGATPLGKALARGSGEIDYCTECENIRIVGNAAYCAVDGKLLHPLMYTRGEGTAPLAAVRKEGIVLKILVDEMPKSPKGCPYSDAIGQHQTLWYDCLIMHIVCPDDTKDCPVFTAVAAPAADKLATESPTVSELL